MPMKAIVAGVILVLIGLGGYVISSFESPTALIPAAIGAILWMLGMGARRETLRKHLMHAAAAVALLGLVPSLIRLSGVLVTGTVTNPVALVAQALTALVCLWFLLAAIRSFVAARRSQS